MHAGSKKRRNKELLGLDIHKNGERNRILIDFNNTKTEYPKNKAIQQIFEEQVQNRPKSVAIVYGQCQLTYRELNSKANQLARKMIELGIKPNEIIGLITERSIEMVIGMVAVLKAGCAYLPIDPKYPKERKQFMVDDGHVSLLLICEQDKMDLDYHGVILNLGDNSLYSGCIDNIDTNCNGNSLAYIMYTSGSTGWPKGVMVEHRNVIRLVKNTNYINFTQQDAILQTGAVVFDASTFEIWGSLLNGIRLCLVDNDVILNRDKLEKAIESLDITIMWLTSSLFNQLSQDKPDMFKKLNYLLVGGEVLSSKHINQVRKSCPNLKVINGYGPTENTTFSICHLIEKDYEQNIPIGKPISNSTAYIIGENNKLQPIGVAGELLVGGDGVARGYLNNTELTKEKFIDNPFVTGERAYRTGDLARWLPDGNIEFLGRIDGQVKIRGYRIEPKEIETVLTGHKDVKEAVVLVKTDQKDNKYLCAYLVIQNNLSVREIREYLSGRLPDYMVPSDYIEISKIPLTLNGKVDIKALSETRYSMSAGVSYEAPSNKMEEKLVEIWKEVLGAEQVGIRDNFYELGGSSLKAMAIITRIYKLMEIELSITELLQRSNIKLLADYLEKKEKSIYFCIEKSSEMEFYEASSAQKRMFTINQIDKNSVNYNLPMAKYTKEILNKEKIERVFKDIIQKNEVFRTSFHVNDGVIVQKIHQNINFKLKEIIVDFSISDTESIACQLDMLIQPFELDKAPLIRAAIIRLKDANILFFDIHHIIFDGTSQEIFMKEFNALYNGQKINSLNLQYKDFSIWQNNLLKNGIFRDQEQFWIEKFKNGIPDCNIFADYSTSKTYRFIGKQIVFYISDDVRKKIKNLLEKVEVTPFILYLSVLNILLAKYTTKEDIVIGTPVAGRTHIDFSNMIGLFVNTVVQRNYPTGNKAFIQFLKEVKNNTYESIENQDYPFEKLIERLSISTEDGRNPLFSVFFTMQNFEEELYLDNVKLKSYNIKKNVSKLDLAWLVSDNGSCTEIVVEYNVDLYKKNTIERMIEHYLNILTSVIENAEIKIKDIEIISKKEKSIILDMFNNTIIDYERDKTVIQLFEECVSNNEGKVIVISDEKKVTYKELNDSANQLAHYLRKRGISTNDIIGIICDRSIDTLISMLGVVKSGAAYIPIDMDYPLDRIEYMLKDSKSRFLISGIQKIKNISIPQVEVVSIRDKKIIAEKTYNPILVNNPKDMIYVMYTSGSTGKPKGVCVEHRGVVRLVRNNSHFVINKDDRILSVLSMGFDPTVLEVWGSLLNNVPLVLASKDKVLDVEALELMINVHNITFLQLSSSLFTSLTLQNTSVFKNIRHLIVGGDVISPEAVNKVLSVNKTIEIVNAYGPTENTVTSTHFMINNMWNTNKPIPIGKPISNSTCYIMDQYSKLQPIGVVGEICLGGDGVARGYLNKKELTQEKFINSEYFKGGRIYKTGDLGRWLSDGNIEFIGRSDNQVKIRGFRVEVSEVEKVIKNYSIVKNANVIVKQDTDNNKILCAYVVADKKIEINECRDYISQHLPEYMIPQYIIQIDKLPLTTNGKIDIKALPEPDNIVNIGNSYKCPENELQKQLVRIWSKVLSINKVGIDDNFFWLGGHSLKAINIISKIHKEMEIEISLTDLFKYPTIRKLSKVIETLKLDKYEQIKPIKEKAYYKVSPQQLRIYTVQQFDKKSITYNTPTIFMINGKVDVLTIKNAFTEIMKRHESLRTSFHQVGTEIVQKINDFIEVDFKHINIYESELETYIQEFVKPFKLYKAPLFRVSYVQLDNMKSVLLIDMHHIISDGRSMDIIVNELNYYYNNKKMPNVRIQYKDYTTWQQNFFNTSEFKKQEKYWISNLKKPIPILDLPTDYKRQPIQSFRGNNVTYKIEEETVSKIKDFVMRNRCTLHMLIIAAFTILLAKYSSQEDIVIGTVTSGRFRRDLDNTVGMFVNTLPIRNKPKGYKTVIEFLNEVKITLLKAYENELYPFEKLIDALKIKRDISRNFIFDVMVSTLNLSNEVELKFDELYIQREDIYADIAKFDITLYAIEHVDTIEMKLNYCTDLFIESTIETMAKHLLEIINCIIENENMPINRISLSNTFDAQYDEVYEDMLDMEFDFI